jgi:hypothetical protein
MPAKILVNVHIGVISMPLPVDTTYAKMVVEITDCEGTTQTLEIGSTEQPVPDEVGNPQFVAGFSDVRSGGVAHIEVHCEDTEGNLIGIVVTHDADLADVPDPEPGTYPAPSFIFVTV